ncbi:hypothetical protein [Saccharopolyspora sp. NPDC050642]|uniref:hypothetical protein n=1 Tax=Saccharopolyspora sp. NPDC050642 TaxID=3157099 RepID=UPI0033F67992
MTAIWRNREFRALPADAQRVYLLLVTQPDISATGTLPLTLRRWADMASDTTVDGVTGALQVLSDKKFIVVDYDTEELLVRSFVKWDGGHTNSKRRPVILRAAEEIVSTLLRRVLRFEFQRLDLPTDALRDAVSDSPSDTASPQPEPEPLETAHDPAFSQVDSPSDTASDATSAYDGVVVTQVSTGEPTTHNPQPIPPSAGDAAPANAQQILGDWLQTCRKRPPKNVVGQIGRNVKALLEEGIDPSDVHDGLMEWARKSLHPSTLPSVVNEVMNRPHRTENRPRRTDTKADRIDALDAFLVPDEPHLRALPGGAA